jgi:cell division septation protein DedD
LFASIQVGENTPGFILNISEGGLCVQTARKISCDWPLRLRFQSLQSHGWVEAQGKIVWNNETNTLAGIEFVDLAPEARNEVQTWLSFGNSLQELRGNWAADRAGMPTPTDADTGPQDSSAGVREYAVVSLWDSCASHPQDSAQAKAEPEPAAPLLDETPASPAPVRQTPAFAVFAIALGLIFLAALAGQHAYLGRGVESLFSNKTAASVQGLPSTRSPAPAAEIPTPSAASQPPPPAFPSEAGKPTLPPNPIPYARAKAGSKFALQVAAMREEENANQLAESLRSKNYPASVSRRPGDHLYKVLVGPYADSQSARSVQDALEKEGIQPLVKRWTP